MLHDHSLAYAYGIFPRLTSNCKGKPTRNDILTKVRSDEEKGFGMLDIKDASEGNQ